MAQVKIKSVRYQTAEMAATDMPAKIKMEEEHFNYDLERMKQRVNGKAVEVPDCKGFDEFEKWIMSA